MQNLSPNQLSIIINCLFLQLFALNEGNSTENPLDEPIALTKETIASMGYDPETMPDNEGEPIGITYPDPNYKTIMSY